jgi:hypothetical protein
MPEHLLFILNYASSFPLKSNVNVINLTSYSQVPVSLTPTHIIDQSHSVPTCSTNAWTLMIFRKINLKPNMLAKAVTSHMCISGEGSGRYTTQIKEGTTCCPNFYCYIQQKVNILLRIEYDLCLPNSLSFVIHYPSNYLILYNIIYWLDR